MSYQVLARKYRPRSFDTLVGQEHVVRALTHALEQQRLHHAYLFTGTRGVGKTTLSRILAKSLNCVGTDGNGGITAAPCGVCEACVAIDAGRFVDYIEMDAASNRGVDEMAQLLEQAVYAPSNARFKVYMIDEVHMLTNHAFNAMLKTLEEPPAHIKFILATTDPQKIPVTVLSRCLQFNLKQMPPGHIIGHLDNILNQEGIEFDPPALRLLAQGASGSMRDALSLTDQAIAYAAGKVTLEAVQGMLGALDQSYLIRILDALAAQDGAALLGVADDMAARSLSYNAALQDLGTLLHQVALAQSVPAALADDVPNREDILRLSSQFSPEHVQLFYQIAVHGRNELGLAPDEYAGFSMTLLRMLAFRPVSANAAAPVPAAGGAPGPRPPAARQAAPLVAPQAAVTSAPVVRAPVAPAPAAPAARPAPSAAPAAAPSSAREAALMAARASIGKNGKAPSAPRPAAPVPAPAPAAAPVASAAPEMPPSMPEPPPFDSMPPWEEDAMPAGIDAQKKTEYSRPPDVSEEAFAPAPPAVPAAPQRPAATPAQKQETLRIAADLGWDGHWPSLAASLPLRGVVHQMAFQSELVRCESLAGGNVCFHLRIPLETLRSSGSVEKLMAALSERFGREVRVETEIGAVADTANAVAEADRAERQRKAEQKMQNDPFVLSMMREFGASIVPGSIHPL
ncbi:MULTISPECIES: DNA polymerase III subunit gamma/tau [unclassified Herbaspirillum]|uniref:DNA polymerase III subunit gamma/tau n=1 Tax=unclassified Herbaspirillum TaxID=2624150 RepID=UPI001153652D|nr:MULTISPECIES: DNA polymerase III subunit gamma/tau [unclassified Herbaspirillum]MBB5391224.1 DNA polymerase-3 subunit gamma/tau [Herbaspirillum sp. SJZ102]TQK13085.1 DNA polymerase III gamma subunit /DNA polymerase III tau subunit [Herbaspirillum sp. SJZ130]TQK15089.1 DNA polymerase III gamma subunit /DNA polymerase III tau subunit [Herbaspirillum sp. SJZ106]